MLTQQNAHWMLAIPKVRVSDEVHSFMPGSKLAIDLKSPEAQEQFILDISSHAIKLSKIKFQTRVRKSIGLVRLDVNGPPHRNPDGTVIPCPHVHLYREGWELKWATPAPFTFNGRRLTVSPNMYVNLEEFFSFCNIVEPPLIQGGLFGL